MAVSANPTPLGIELKVADRMQKACTTAASDLLT